MPAALTWQRISMKAVIRVAVNTTHARGAPGNGGNEVHKSLRNVTSYMKLPDMEFVAFMCLPWKCDSAVTKQPLLHLSCALTGSVQQCSSPEVGNASQKIPNISCNPMIHYRIHKSLPLLHVLSQMNLTPSHPIPNIRFNNIAPPTSKVS